MKPGKRRTRDDRRRELVDAAIAAVRRHGAGASMEQLAAEGGVTKPILYRHFGDRDGLVRAIGTRFVGELMDELRSALTQDAEPEALLTATIDAYLAFVERDPDMYRFLARQSGSITSAAEGELGGFIRLVAQEVTIVLGERLRAAGLDSGPAEPWAFGMVGMVHLAGDWWLDRRTMPRTRLVSYLVDLLWSGIQGVAARAAAGGAEAGGDEAPGEDVPDQDVIDLEEHREANRR